MQEIKLEEAGKADISTINALAVKIWNQYYPSILTREQIGYMIGQMYSNDSLHDQMSAKGHRFFLIIHSSVAIGFVSVMQVTGDNWFINKFYIDQEKAARGIGTSAFHELQKTISPKTLKLTVNRKNFKSINFYFKLGFRIESVEDFDIGGGFVMNDFVMGWKSVENVT